jgi:CHRD domain
MVHVRRTVAAAVAIGALGALGVTGASGATTTLKATLKGANEVPKAGTGTGTATLTVNAKTGRVCYTMKLKGIGKLAAAHIHKGGPRVAGPVVVPLITKPTSKLSGCVTAKPTLAAAIKKSPAKYYVNVHTAKFPAGAARGQLR